jgi:hypothetical protein
MYASYSQEIPYSTLSSSCSDMPLYPTYLHSVPTTLSTMDYPIKQEPFIDAEVNPFNMTYASIAGIDISGQSYTDSNPHTPPLSECFEHSVAGSPPESTMPSTPPFTSNFL